MPARFERETTIRKPFSLTGINVYNGREAEISFSPAPAGTGIVFETGGVKIPARLKNAQKHLKSIWLASRGARVGLVEHALASLYAMGIDNAVVRVPGGVCPTFDNAAMPYVRNLEGNVRRLDRKRTIYAVSEARRARSREGPDRITVRPGAKGRIEYVFEYPHRALGGVQSKEIRISPADFKRELSRARSPSFLGNRPLSKVVLLGSRVLGVHGITERNSLLIGSKRDAHYLNSRGYGVRYGGSEAVRHKLVDALAALALTGKRFRGSFLFERTGHAFDIDALKQLERERVFKPA